MVGQAVTAAATRRGWLVSGAARHGAEVALDLADEASIASAVDTTAPNIIVNAAALTDLAACEADPASAHAINATSVGRLAVAAARKNALFVHVSTDQYWSGDGVVLHDEDAPAVPVNEYGKSKLAGEKAAFSAAVALVLRTNVTGLRGWVGKPTFAEWLCDAISKGLPLTLFDDYFTSTIDSASFADALLDLAEKGASGLLNVAARGAHHKAAFAAAMGRAMHIAPNVAATASVRALKPRRAESAGLYCARAEAILGRPMPDLDTVCRNIVRQISHHPERP
jgi:dTDP-4-dehydrorhamnose reductase